MSELELEIVSDTEIKIGDAKPKAKAKRKPRKRAVPCDDCPSKNICKAQEACKVDLSKG